MDIMHGAVTEKIIKAYYKVYNTLGYGFLEKVYQNALILELRKYGLNTLDSKRIEVFYESEKVGIYIADIIVDDKVIIEVKAMDSLREEHEYQLINYLKATELEVGILLNFGKKPEFKRKVFTNNIG